MKEKNVLNKTPHLVKVQNQTSEDGGKKAKLYLHGDIGPSWYDSISLEVVKNKLETISDVEELEVHINSNGGDVFESIAIMNYLVHERSERIVTFIDGLAASGGSVIFMAGAERIMPSNTQMMIHNPWTITYGNAKELRKTADDLESIQTSLEECYLSNFIGTREELKDLLDYEKFMTADESEVFGFATKVIKAEKDTITSEDPKASLFNKYAAKALSGKKISGFEENEPSENIEGKNLIKNLIKSL